MRKRTDMTLPGLAGALVVAAVMVCAWAARDSSAGTDDVPHARDHLPARSYYSARSHRGPVTRTSIPPREQRTPTAESTPNAATH